MLKVKSNGYIIRSLPRPCQGKAREGESVGESSLRFLLHPVFFPEAVPSRRASGSPSFEGRQLLT